MRAPSYPFTIEKVVLKKNAHTTEHSVTLTLSNKKKVCVIFRAVGGSQWAGRHEIMDAINDLIHLVQIRQKKRASSRKTYDTYYRLPQPMIASKVNRIAKAIIGDIRHSHGEGI